MPAKPSGETKVYIIHDTQDNGDVYVYRREVEYDPARRNNRVRSSKLLGKIRKGESEMIPTRPRRKRADGQEGGSTAVQTGGTGAGIADILEHIGRESGIDEAILRHAGEGTARKILSIARYLAATGGQPLPGMAIWQTTHCLPYTDEITEDLCNDLFLSVGRDEALQQGYFADRCRSLGDRSALACDLTVYPVELLKESQDMDAVEAHRDGQNSIKFVTLHSAGERQPFAFAGTDSPLSDIARIDLALERLSVLGMENILLMAEDGFRSEDSALELCLTGCDYVTPAPISTSWVRAELDQAMAGGRFETTGSVCPFDVDVHCATAALTHAFRQTKLYRKYRNGLEDNLDEDSFSHNIYLHLYLNTRDRDEYNKEFDEILISTKKNIEDGILDIDNLPDDIEQIAGRYMSIERDGHNVHVTYNEEAIAVSKKYNGCYALASNCEHDPFSALQACRSRSRIESFFEDIRKNIDSDHVHAEDSDIFSGYLFVRFVALCYHEYFCERIRKMSSTLGRKNGNREHDRNASLERERELKSWLDSHSAGFILNWFEPVEAASADTPAGTGRWRSEIAERDSLFLGLLGMKTVRA